MTAPSTPAPTLAEVLRDATATSMREAASSFAADAAEWCASMEGGDYDPERARIANRFALAAGALLALAEMQERLAATRAISRSTGPVRWHVTTYGALDVRACMRREPAVTLGAALTAILTAIKEPPHAE